MATALQLDEFYLPDPYNLRVHTCHSIQMHAGPLCSPLGCRQCAVSAYVIYTVLRVRQPQTVSAASADLQLCKVHLHLQTHL